MAETLNVPEVLAAFWHKTRCQFVPLTSYEWDRRAGIGNRDRARISGRQLVAVDRGTVRKDHIYHLSQAGFEVLRDSGVLVLPQRGDMAADAFMRALGITDQTAGCRE